MHVKSVVTIESSRSNLLVVLIFPIFPHARRVSRLHRVVAVESSSRIDISCISACRSSHPVGRSVEQSHRRIRIGTGIRMNQSSKSGVSSRSAAVRIPGRFAAGDSPPVIRSPGYLHKMVSLDAPLRPSCSVPLRQPSKLTSQRC